MYLKMGGGERRREKKKGRRKPVFPTSFGKQTFFVPVFITVNRRLRRGDTENEQETEMWGVASQSLLSKGRDPCCKHGNLQTQKLEFLSNFSDLFDQSKNTPSIYILSAGAWQRQELMPSTAEPFLGTSVCSDSASEPLRAVCIPGKIQRVSVFPLSECFGTTRTNKEFHFLTSHGAQSRSFCSKTQIWRESGALFNQSFVRVWILGRTTGRPVCQQDLLSMCRECTYVYMFTCIWACIYACMIFHVSGHMSAHAYDHMCMWRPEVEAENHL